MTLRSHIGLLVGLVVLGVGLIAPFDGMSASAQRAVGITVWVLVFWMTEPVRIEYTSLAALLLLPVAGVIPFRAAFSAFSGTSIWLIFAGLVLSLGLTETGLGKRLAFLFLCCLGGTPARLLLSLHLIGLVLALLIPSGVVRVFILIPIGIGLMDALGERPGSKLSAAIILSLVCSTYYGGCGLLTASVPNLMVFGALERAGETMYWGTWAKLMFPVIGLIRTGICYGLILLLFGRGGQVAVPSSVLNQRQEELGPMSEKERQVILILCLGVLAWATDFIHHIHPTYVALCLVLLYFLPRFGPLSFDAMRGANFPLLFYIAAVFAIGEALDQTGFTDLFVRGLTGWVDLRAHGWFMKYFSITLLTVPFDFLMDTAAVAGVLTPSMMGFGQSQGLSAMGVGMSVGVGTSLVFLPYQAAPFMIAYGFRRMRMGQLVMTMMLVSLISVLVLAPLNLVYWRWIGFI